MTLATLSFLTFGILNAFNGLGSALDVAAHAGHAGHAGQDPVRIWATISPNPIAAGETATLEIHLETRGERAELITVPDLPPEFEIVRTSDYTQLQFSLPGGRNRIIRREIVLRATTPGSFRIPPITTRVQGAEYRTRELTITVADRHGTLGSGTGSGFGSGSGAPGGGARGAVGGTNAPWTGSGAPHLGAAGSTARGPRDEVILHARIMPDTADVHQQVTLRAQTWVSEETQLRLRRAPEYHPPNAPGFWTHDLPGPVQSGRQTFDDRLYRVQEFQRAYFPLASGEYTLPPARLVYEVRRGFLYSTDDQDLATDSLRLVVLPLPEAGRPANFTGAVGRFSIRARLEPSEVPAGEATALVVEVEGSGNINALPPPRIPELSGIDYHSPGEDARIRIAQGEINGVKRFTWVLVPREPGAMEIPAIEYPYFDPELGQYLIASAAPLTLGVQPGHGIAASATTAPPVIRALKAEPAGAPPLAWVRSPGFTILLVAPLLALVPLIIIRRRAAHPRLPTVRKRKRTSRRLRRATLLELRREAAASGPELFHALDALIRKEIALLLGSPGMVRSAADTLAAALADHGVPTATTHALASLLTRIESARYQPATPGAETRLALIEEAEHLLSILDRQGHDTRRTRRASPSATTGILPLLVLALSGADPSRPSDRPGADEVASAREDYFHHATARFHDGDFDGAVQGFTEFLRAHPRDPHGWYNLGNAEFHSGRRGPAIYAWLRALRLTPRDPDTRFNLRFVGADPDLIRAAAGRLPLAEDELLLLAGLAWLAGITAFIMYAITRRRATARAGAAVIALALIAVTARLAPVRHNSSAIALQDQSPLRVAPDHRAEMIRLLDGGTRLQIRERRGEWFRVTIDDVEGWVEDHFIGEF